MIQSAESVGEVNQGPWSVVFNEQDSGFCSGWQQVSVDGDLYDPNTAIIRLAKQIRGTDFYTAYVTAQMVAATLEIRQGTALESDRDQVAIAHASQRMPVTKPIVSGEMTLGQAARTARLALLEILSKK